MANESKTIVEIFGSSSDSHCGYCSNREDENKWSYGMWAHCMTVDDYLELLDRGWRRSGKYVYKPMLKQTCCPQYTIRCNAIDFKPSKSQRRVLNRMKIYLSTGVKPKYTHNDHQSVTNSTTVVQSNRHIVDGDKGNENMEKKKTIRKRRALERLAKKGIDADMAQMMRKERQPKRKDIEDFLVQLPTDMHRLTIDCVRVNSTEFNQLYPQSYQLYKRYQMRVHNDAESKITESSFRRFLIDTPLINKDNGANLDGTVVAINYGSFHHRYMLDGQLIAVGVVDVLPRCVSSKYFFYDPDYSFLSLGTYSALREIAFTRKLATISSELRYYYLGYYVHRCAKMRYKSRFRPCDLLCDESKHWISIDRCLPLLDQSKYSRFDDTDTMDNDVDVNQVTVLYKRIKCKYGQIGENRSDHDQVNEYAQLVGSKCSQSMLLYLE